MPSRNTIEIIINATDNASRVFNSLGDNSQKLGGLITAGIVGGLATATAAITGFAAKGLQEFTSFQQGITEVFTLLPGISEDAMSKMEKDVEGLSTTFGVLPDKVIPALYQALSAGVPQDNVFEFLRTASQASVGGVVDLESAVDGITSVLNAYGLSADKASQISDVMFTGIRLGKTTFTELSQSLFQVIPSASALGVSFGDVTAALASITSQGTPTSVATTQLRQLFVELSKAGGKAADTFEQMAGKSFKDFIAGGGNVQDALKLMEKAASDSGLSISDMFSSVEAGNAALQLTGKGAERFTDFIDQMNNSTGATGKAFETMSDTLQFQLNKMFSAVSVLFVEIGRIIEPIVKPIIQSITEIIRVLTNAVSGEYFIDTIDEVGDSVRPLAKIIMNVSSEVRRIWGILSRFFDGIKAGVPFLDNLKAVMYSLFPKSTADAINTIINAVNTLWMKIKPIIDSIIEWVSNNVELKDVLIAVGIAIGSFVVPAIIAIGAAIAPLIGTFALLVGGVTLLRKAWETDFLGIQTFVLEKLIPALQMLADWFLKDALPKAINFVQNVALPALQLFIGWLGGVWETVKPALEAIANWFINDALPAVLNFITNVVIPGIGNFITTLVNIWNTVKPHLENLYNWFVTTALPALVRFVEGTIIPGIQKFVDFLVGIWAIVSPELTKIYNWFVTEALPSIVSFIDTTIIPGIQRLIDIIFGIWTFIEPTLSSIFDWFINTGLPAIVGFITDTVLPAIRNFRNTISGIWNAIKTPLESVYNFFKDKITQITDWIQPIIDSVQELIRGIQEFLGLNQQGSIVNTGQGEVVDWANRHSNNVSNPNGVGLGNYNGLAYAPKDMGIKIHQGERVLTKDENKAYTNGQNQSSSPMITIENLVLGDIQNQNDANDKARMFVNGLRAQGMEI